MPPASQAPTPTPTSAPSSAVNGSLSLEFTSPRSLGTLHSMARVSGGNQIPWQAMRWNANNELTFDSTPFLQYAVGVVVPAGVFFIFFLVWFLSFCCYRCWTLRRRLTKTSREEIKRRSTAFIVLLGLCMVCLIVALGCALFVCLRYPRRLD